MNTHLLSDLRLALGDAAVLTDDRSREMRVGDAFNPRRGLTPSETEWWQTPPVVVMPTTTEQVSQALRIASQHRAPVVPFGGGTGVMGGAVVPANALVLALKGMSRIRSVSAEDNVVWVEAGMMLADLDAALGKHGLMLGHDPWSTPIATVGGAISTDGHGYRAAKYGSMGAQVLGLEVVLADGEVLHTNAVSQHTSGPNLERLFIGSEGAFGVITAAGLRVFRLPEARRFAAFTFPSFEAGFAAVSEMFALGLRPAITDLTENPEEAGDDSKPLLILTYEGYREEVGAQSRRAKSIALAHGGVDDGPAKAHAYWRDRHVPGERYKKEALPFTPRERWGRWWSGRGHWDGLALCLPVSKVLEHRRQAQAICREAGVSIHEYALWGGPELYSLGLSRAAVETDPNDRAAFRAVSDRLLCLAQDMGGSIEYCHGIGLKLLHLAEREWGPNLEAVRRIKQALDPHGIMNPGKLGL